MMSHSCCLDAGLWRARGTAAQHASQQMLPATVKPMCGVSLHHAMAFLLGCCYIFAVKSMSAAAVTGYHHHHVTKVKPLDAPLLATGTLLHDALLCTLHN
jgi:hypothetical protein